MNFAKKITCLILVWILLTCNFVISASAASDLTYGIGFVNVASLCLYKEPNTDASILDTACLDECVVILSKSEGWYKVNFNLQIGYMQSDSLDASVTENAELGYGRIAGSDVNVRSGPSISAGVITVSSKSDICYIIGINEGWYKVIYKNEIGYIRSDYVELTEIPYENKASVNSPKFFRRGKSTGVAPSGSALNGNPSDTSTPSTNPGNVGTLPSGAGTDILLEAQKYLGTPYVSGGASPSGFDCSGFVYYVLKQLGYAPYRTPPSQYTMGTYVEKKNLQPGDIVFFAGTGANRLSHVGIYAGDGQFIHAPNSRSTVSYSDLTSGYWSVHYFGARRVY
ncbi:MAG: C40 family peptidase [Oscillospiraceae bacterium]|nr:C40 family peptidase [Oscillospiraceae bacterium]